MKKRIGLLMVGVLLIFGCVGCSKEQIKNVEVETTAKFELDKSNVTELITIDGGYSVNEFNFGSYKASITNVSRYDMASVNIKYEYTDADGNINNTYLSTYNLLESGASSKVIDTLGGSDNMKPVFLEIVLINKSGDKHYVKYDYNTNKIESEFDC